MAKMNPLVEQIKNMSQTQSSSAASTNSGRSIDNQLTAFSQALSEQPSTFKSWNPETTEETKPKKKKFLGITIPDGSENVWDYDATNNIIDTSAPATPKIEEPKAPEKKQLEYSDAFLRQEDQKDSWQPTWSNDRTIMDKQEVNDIERVIATTTGAAKQYGSGMVNLYGTTAAGLNELGQALGGNTNEYAGWATDPISSAAISHENNPEYYEREKRYTDTVQAVADSLSESASADLNKAKQGLGKLGQFGVDLATNMIQMGFDAGLAFLTGGGSALVPMFLRSTGSAEQEARQAGATTWEQIFSGNLSGGIEVLTEKAFDGLAGIYGKGAADEITEEVIRKLSKTDIGRSALRFIGGMVEEGGEEVLSDLLNPFVKTIYNNKSLLDNYKDLDPSEILYDFLVGAAVSGAATGTSNWVNRGAANTAANSILAETDEIENALLEKNVPPKDASRLAQIIEKASNNENLTQNQANILDENKNLIANTLGLVVSEGASKTGRTITSIENSAPNQLLQTVNANPVGNTQAVGVAPTAANNGNTLLNAVQQASTNNVNVGTPAMPTAPNVSEEAAPVNPLSAAETEKTLSQQIDEHSEAIEQLRTLPESVERDAEIVEHRNEIAMLQAEIRRQNEGVNPSIMNPEAAAEGVVAETQQEETATPTEIANTVPTTEKSLPVADSGVTVKPGPPVGKVGLSRLLTNNLPNIANMSPVSALTGLEMNDKSTKLSTQIANFFKSFGNAVHRNGFGDILFSDYGISSVLNHRPLNRAKIVTLTAVPDIVRDGEIIAQSNNWKGRGYPSYVFAAPVTINGEQVYVAAAVNDAGGNKFYLNEVVDSNGNYVRIESAPADTQSLESPSEDGITSKSTEADSEVNIAQNAENVNTAETESAIQEESSPLVEQEATSEENENPLIRSEEETTTETESEFEPETETETESSTEEQPEFEEARNRAKTIDEQIAQERAAMDEIWNAATEAGVELTDEQQTEIDQHRQNIRNLVAERNDTLKNEVPTQSNIHGMYTKEEAQMEGLNPEKDTHTRHEDKAVDEYAQKRIDTNRDQALDNILTKDPAAWTDVDVRTAEMLIQDQIQKARNATGAESDEAYRVLADLKEQYNQQGTEAGRALRQRQRLVTPEAVAEDIVSEAARILYGDESEGNLRRMSPEQKEELMQAITGFADDSTNIPDGDVDSVIDMIKQIDAFRGTCGLFATETGKGMSKLLDTASEFEDADEFLRGVLQNQIRAIANDQIRLNPGEAIRSIRFNNMLSNFATILRNFTANPIMDLAETLSTNQGVLVDMLLSKFTGTRTVAFDKGWLSEAKRQGSTEAFVKSLIIEGLDASPKEGSNAKYESMRNGRTFKMSGGAFERVLSTWSKYLNFGLKSTDELMKGGIQAETERGLSKLAEQGKLTEKAEKALEDRGEKVAKERTLQKDDGVAGTISRMRGEAGWLGEQIMPFAQVPVNATVMATNYTPLGVASTIYEVGKAVKAGKLTAEQQAKLATQMGRNGTAFALIGTAFALAMKGIILSGQDEDKDKAALEKAEGLSGRQLNLSALQRWITGESTEKQKDDVLVGLAFLEFLSASMEMGAALADDYRQNGRVTFGDIALDNLGAVSQSVLDLPALSQVSSAIQAYEYSDADKVGGKIVDAAVGLAGSTASGYVVPNFLRGIAKGIDKYDRVTYTGDDLENSINYVKSGIPGLRETLPIKVDPLGNEIVREDNALLNFLNATTLPGEVRTYQPYAVSDELSRVTEATGKSAYPNRNAPNKINGNNGETVELSTEDKTEYIKIAGSKTDEYLTSLFNNKYYSSLSEAEQYKAIKEMESLAQDEAKAEMCNRKDVEYTSDARLLFSGKDAPGTTYDKTALNPDNIADYVAFKTGYNAAIKASDYASIDNFVNSYDSLDRNTRTVLSENMGDLKNLLEYSGIGVDSKSYYAVKESISNAQIALDKSAKTGTDVKMLGLVNAPISEYQRGRIINGIDGFVSNAMKNSYDVLSGYGFNSKQVYEFFSNADYRVNKKTGEVVTSGAGQLDAAEAAYGISKLPGLTDKQRSAIFNEMKKSMSNYYNDWKNYTYTSEMNYINSGRSKYSYGKGGTKDNPLLPYLDVGSSPSSSNSVVNQLLPYLNLG